MTLLIGRVAPTPPPLAPTTAVTPVSGCSLYAMQNSRIGPFFRLFRRLRENKIYPPPAPPRLPPRPPPSILNRTTPTRDTTWPFRLASNSNRSTSENYQILGARWTPTRVTPQPRRISAVTAVLLPPRDSLGSFFTNAADTGAQPRHGIGTRRPAPRLTLRSLVQLLLLPCPPPTAL